MLTRVVVFLLLVAVGVGIYLERRTGTEGFSEEVKASLKSALNASEIEMQGLKRVQGELGISGLACKGENGTFFAGLEARNIRCRMSFLDGLAGKWNPGTVSISRLEIDLRAGADDDESAARLADSLFKEFENVELTSIVVADASLRWGYGKSIAPKTFSLTNSNVPQLSGYEFEHTKGSISHSTLRVQRIGEGYRLSLRGGKFSQNWLQNLEIVEIEAICDREGIHFEKASFRRLQGTVDFSGLTVAGGARPQIDGTVVVRNLPLGVMLPPSVRSLVEGSISGDFRVTGSTNSSEGIIFEGGVTLDTPDMVSLRKKLHLLEALSVVDYSRNYHRINFREGSFQLKMSRGGLELTDVHLKSDDQISLDGNMSVRLPTYEETRDFLDRGASQGGAMLDSRDADLEALEESNDDDFNLRRAAEESNQSGNKPDETTLFGRLEQGMNLRTFEEQASENLSRTLRYQGLFTITLPPDAFDRAPRLSELFPVNPETNRIPMDVPIEGSIYEITLKQAEDIYQQGRR